MYYTVYLIKALACLLIANFHSDILFPDKLSLLAFGGDVGNNMFFMVSGFTLLPSVEKCREESIGKWFLGRLFRLLPMLFFFYLCSFITGGVTVSSFGDAVQAFIFPTLYWFTGAIVPFYILFFAIEKYTNSFVCGGLVFLLIILHICLDNIFAERYFIGFIAMLVGATVYKNYTKLTERVRIGKAVFAILFTGGSYVILKLLRGSGMDFFSIIHLGIGILTICLAVEILLLGGAYENKMKLFFEKHSMIYYIVKRMSEITLAVYLVMGFNSRVIMQTVKSYVRFPFSYMVNIVISFTIAYLITIVDKKLHRKKG